MRESANPCVEGAIAALREARGVLERVVAAEGPSPARYPETLGRCRARLEQMEREVVEAMPGKTGDGFGRALADAWPIPDPLVEALAEAARAYARYAQWSAGPRARRDAPPPEPSAERRNALSCARAAIDAIEDVVAQGGVLPDGGPGAAGDYLGPLRAIERAVRSGAAPVPAVEGAGRIARAVAGGWPGASSLGPTLARAIEAFEAYVGAVADGAAPAAAWPAERLDAQRNARFAVRILEGGAQIPADVPGDVRDYLAAMRALRDAAASGRADDAAGARWVAGALTEWAPDSGLARTLRGAVEAFGRYAAIERGGC